ncbi:MAG: hypothetical protein ACT4P5_06655 [Armatimonadota bacterium]
MSVKHCTIKDVASWYQHTHPQIFLGGVLDEKNSDAMSVGFCRYDKGESNEWILTYDEANIVTKGAFTVRSAEGEVTAKAGEVLFFTKGTKLTYEGAEDGTEVVYVTYPHWMEAQRKSEHADLLDPGGRVRDLSTLDGRANEFGARPPSRFVPSGRSEWGGMTEVCVARPSLHMIAWGRSHV